MKSTDYFSTDLDPSGPRVKLQPGLDVTSPTLGLSWCTAPPLARMSKVGAAASQDISVCLSVVVPQRNVFPSSGRPR